MNIVGTATAVVQLVGLGKELVDLWKTGRIDEDELVERWNQNVRSLSELEASWVERQRMKRKAQTAASPSRTGP